VEELLALARKVAEAAEVFMVSSEETPIQFEANRLKHIQSKQSTTVALRLIRQGRLGYATTTELNDRSELVNLAAETAQFGMTAGFEFPALTVYPPVEIFDPAAESVPVERMVRLGEELVNALRQHTPELLCHAWVSKSTTTVRIMNSRGGQASYRQTSFNLATWSNLIRGTDMLFVGDSQSSCHPVLDTSAVSRAVIQQLELARDLASAPSKSLPVIFTPIGVAGALIAPLMTAFSGKTVLEGASPIGSKLGQAVFDSKFSLWDDPTLPYRPSSRPCDDEGVPSQRTPLIERGVVTSFFYDLQTAALAGKRSTGNGDRARGLPAPSPTAFVIASGNTTFDQMVGDIKEGLVIEELMGAEQGNILGGDFSGNVLLGYKIENGKIVGRVKDTMVSGNIYQLLKEVTAIGSDARWVGGFVNTPSLYFPRVSVASK
jgi:PmbA protein